MLCESAKSPPGELIILELRFITVTVDSLVKGWVQRTNEVTPLVRVERKESDFTQH